MRTILRVTAAAIAAVLTITPLVGAWSSFGAYEPDTVHDTEEWMFTEPGPATADHVYFNGWSSTQAAVNYNVGALQTSIEAPEMDRPLAIMGIWVDCNGDGYVGHAESALYEYSATLLLDASTCPSVTGDADDWTEGAHNYNGWVTELVPIGRPTTNEDGPTDSRVYADEDSKVWGDIGLPTAVPGGSCAINPFPRGTMQSTGGLLNYLDCRYQAIDQVNFVLFQLPGGQDLMFPDDEDATAGDAPLDQPTFGSEHTDYAAVSVIDCSAGPMAETGSSVNSTGAQGPLQTVLDAGSAESGEDLGQGYEYYDVSVPTINPQTMNTQNPTAPGQTNQTLEETDDCDTSNDAGHDFYGTLNEGEWASDNSRRGKQASFWSFEWFEGTRGDVGEFLIGVEAGFPADGAAGTSGSFGAGGSPGYGLFASAWFGIGNMVKDHNQVFDTRSNLNNEDPAASDIGADIDPGFTVSYFGYTSLTGFVMPGGADTFGSHACGDNDEDSLNGWDCNAANWNLNEDGTPLDGQEWFAFVHDPYNLRDIDCYDGNIGTVGVGVQPEFYGGRACDRPE